MIVAKRYHDISVGHRVCGHEGCCAHLHGHNLRVHFTVVSDELDAIGRVMDFSVIKSKLCMWLEDNWDHRFLIFDADPWAHQLQMMDPDGVVIVPFNPTSEALAEHLGTFVGPAQFEGTGVRLIEVQVDETMKCSAVWRDRK